MLTCLLLLCLSERFSHISAAFEQLRVAQTDDEGCKIGVMFEVSHFPWDVNKGKAARSQASDMELEHHDAEMSVCSAASLSRIASKFPSKFNQGAQPQPQQEVLLLL